MEKQLILERLRAMLTEKHPNVEINIDTLLEFGTTTYLDMSSLEIVEFITAVEEEFNVIVDITERFYTIGDVVDSVFTHLKEDC